MLPPLFVLPPLLVLPPSTIGLTGGWVADVSVGVGDAGVVATAVLIGVVVG